MKPKKQSNLEYVIAGIVFVVVMFFSFKFGVAMSNKALYEMTSGYPVEGINGFNMVMKYFEKELANPNIDFAWNEQIKTALMWGGFLWFIGVAWYFTSKRKYISGKEFGTAEWGTQKDISDLFAVNLMNKEIAQAKKVKTKIGRYFERKKVYKECKKNADDVLAIELGRLEDWKLDNLPSGKLTREQKQLKADVLKKYKENKAELLRKSKELLEESFEEAWKPNSLKRQYEIDVAEINFQAEQGLEITSEEAKQAALAKAKEKYEQALRDFYSGKAKVSKIKAKYENADAIFTKTEHISIYNYILNNNTLILGGSGSGKTRGFVLPNILQAHSSFIITDPKGEILEKAGYFLETVKGYKIRVLNLDNKAQSDGYNPFVYIHPERAGYEERVLMLIEAIIINTDGGEKKGGSDPFWDKAERLFLQAMFFFACDGFVPEEQNMNTVLALIGMLQIEEEQDEHDSDLDFFAEIFEKQHGADHIGVQQYKEFRSKASGKTAKSIVISAVARLAPFRTSAVKRIFSFDTMHLDRVGEEKTALFVVVPPTDPTFNFIAGILFTQLFQELQYCATQVHKHEGQRLSVPVRFILDEFANTATIPQFTKILAYARSFGIGIVPILQSLEQIKTMYKDEWGVIIDNCNTLLYLGSITHMDTLEYMSKLLGKGTFDKKTTGRTRGRSGSSSQNFDVIGRELMDTAEIRKLEKKNCLLVVGGRNPFFSEKYDLKTHPNYKFISDANQAYSYDYIPPEPQKTAMVIKQEANHREEMKEQRIAARVNTIMERVNKEVNEIQMSFNAQNLLNRMGQDFVHYVPIRDELLTTDDGSEQETDEMLLEALNFRDEDEKINMILANVHQRVSEVKIGIERSMSEDEYSLTDKPLEVAKIVIEAGTNLAPIREELIAVQDGEELAEENIEGFIMDSENEEVVENDFGDLSGAIAEVTSIFEELNVEEVAQVAI